MLIGLLAGLGTGALWGLTFVGPRAVEPFTALDLAVARYAVFGLSSALLMIWPAFRPGRVSARRLLTALVLGCTGYVGYYVLIAYAVRLAGAAVPPLIIGLLPVCLAVIGNRRDGSVCWRALAAPLLLIGAGLTAVNGAALRSAGSAEARAEFLTGAALAFGALAIWTVYGVVNARVMRSAGAPEPLPWTGLQGVGAALGALPLLPVSFATGETAWGQHALSSPETLKFALWALLLGVAGSWLATWWWAVASRRLPLALSAQLIAAETVFALIYGFVWERRWPGFAETAGILLLLSGVGLAIRVFTGRPAAATVGPGVAAGV